MSKIWPYDTIRELLALARVLGESTAELANEEDARNFRFAIYSFRRQNDEGNDLSITLDGNKVIVRPKQVPVVKILETSQT